MTSFDIVAVELDDVRRLREWYKRELDDLVRFEAAIVGGKGDVYAVTSHGRELGYGIVLPDAEPTHAVIEFFLLPLPRHQALRIFDRFLEVTGPSAIIARSNDPVLSMLLYDRGCEITAPVIFFRDYRTTIFTVPKVQFRRVTMADMIVLEPLLCRPEARPFCMKDRVELEDWIRRGVGWLLQKGGDLVGMGAIYEHYNYPFVDLAMMVAEPFRQMGYGAYIQQELKKQAYELGFIPAARCSADNVASRATLEKAGFLPTARMLIANVEGAGKPQAGKING